MNLLFDKDKYNWQTVKYIDSQRKTQITKIRNVNISDCIDSSENCKQPIAQLSIERHD